MRVILCRNALQAFKVARHLLFSDVLLPCFVFFFADNFDEPFTGERVQAHRKSTKISDITGAHDVVHGSSRNVQKRNEPGDVIDVITKRWWPNIDLHGMVLRKHRGSYRYQ